MSEPVHDPAPPAPTPPVVPPWTWLGVANHLKWPLVAVVAAFFLGQIRVNPTPDTHPTPDDIKPVVPTISLPESINVPVGKGAVRLDVTTKNATAHVRWIMYPGDESRLQVIPYADHSQVVAIVPGTYWVGADLASADGAAVWCRINSGTPEPPPNNPPPNNPPPDVPPTPIVSPLQQSLQVAYEGDLTPGKSAMVASLADLLANVVPSAKASGKIATVKDFDAFTHSAASIALSDDATNPTKIVKVRQAIAAYLVTVLPTQKTAAADSNYWNKAATEYANVSAALKGVKR